MKRLVPILAACLLTACAGVAAPAAARSDTPGQSLTATGRQMAALRSLRFDANGTVTLTLPPALVDQLRARAGAQAGFLGQSMTVTLKISGAAQRPDQLDAQIQARLGGLTIDTELIATGGAAYYRDPLSGDWKRVRAQRASGDGGHALSYQAVLATAKSVTEVQGNPSTLNGVSVDHYRVVPDLATLFAQATGGHAAKNPQAMAAIATVLQQTSLVADVWTGTGDHLIHRLSYDLDVSADLHQLGAAVQSGAPVSGQGLTIPPGSVAHLTAHVVIDLHDFDARVEIQAPTVAS